MVRKAPSVSLCVPTYNGETYLRECLESALVQTHTDLEVLIVDDDSTDDTLAIVEEFRRRDARLVLHRNASNQGLVANWNRCVALAHGQWIKFLFQDDVLDRRCIERMLADEQGATPLVICRRQILCEGDVEDQDREKFLEFVRNNSIADMFPGRAAIGAEDFIEKFLRDPTHNWIGEPTAALIHRSAFERFGSFNQALVSLCDWEFFARVAVHAGLRLVDDQLATFRVHRLSTSGAQRATKAYRALYLDPIIIRHGMAYDEIYEPLRAQAVSRGESAILIQQLLYAARDARLYAEARAYDPVEPDSGPLVEWRETRQRYPKVDSVPHSYILDWAKRRARHLCSRGGASSTAQA